MKQLFIAVVLSLLSLTTAEECADKTTNCAIFKRLCNGKPQLMKDVCPKTCGICPKPKDWGPLSNAATTEPAITETTTTTCPHPVVSPTCPEDCNTELYTDGNGCKACRCKQECIEGDSKIVDDGCNPCVCVAGVWGCTKMDLSQKSQDWGPPSNAATTEAAITETTTTTCPHPVVSPTCPEDCNTELYTDDNGCKACRCKQETGPGCTDNQENCQGWAEMDECEKNPDYMLTECRKSCGSCVIVPLMNGCADDWPGICGTYIQICYEMNHLLFKWMNENCRKTCGICNGVNVQEENVPNPSGKVQHFHHLNFDTKPQDVKRLAIGDHDYCGPYTQHYSNRQCSVVGLIYGNQYPHGISVKQCEDECKAVAACNAINWSSDIGLGCVLRDCGTGTGPPPMPLGDNPDWLSFSKYKPTITPHCKNLHGSYETTNTYCGPYETYFSDSQCKEVGIHKGKTVLECETLCKAQASCTAFNWSWKKELGCVLRACGVGKPHMPTGVHPYFVSYAKNEPTGAPRCVMDDRNVDP